MEHIKKATFETQDEEGSPCKKKEGEDLHVTFVTHNTITTPLNVGRVQEGFLMERTWEGLGVSGRVREGLGGSL